FADDLLVFTKANEDAIREVTIMLTGFHECLGMIYSFVTWESLSLLYWMLHFVLPSGIIKEVERICNNFLWDKLEGGGEAKVVWKFVALPKHE
ncbi:hypothetical protein LINPERHAP1_LOCUS9339, partial [Linum perenne]